MTIELGLMLAGMLMIGFLAQWLAWRVKLPAILFLLLAGILLGPVSGVLIRTSCLEICCSRSCRWRWR